jgi:SAM-dependent methyltransferase
MLTAAVGARAVLHDAPLRYHAEPGTTPVSVEKGLVLARVPAGARVLEVGAHSGYFSSLLRAQGCAVTALELDPRAAALAAGHADRVIVGDVEDPAVRARLGGPFDRVLFMHVLEHLVDPWGVLRAARTLLAPEGRVVALVPNVACWRIRKQLFFRGAFEYEDTGILDRTHLRFFTLPSARALLETSGYAVVDWAPVDTCVPLERRLSFVPLFGRLAPAWHRLVATRAPNLCTEIALLEGAPR